jgi:hypothetical protein
MNKREELLTVVKLGDEIRVILHKQLFQDEELLKQVEKELNETISRLKNISEEERQEILSYI